ncbi:MAG TPA: antitoxin Xre/MbcA/ParS toxin-binding domain-containing protein [Candidatus Sulfotelmatobacter sp.]|nr:antitoxin Xre/MbcA/ParS toxin-binding domain-containing protein [Candidatus Sulfotelmatobacter sp.]
MAAKLTLKEESRSKALPKKSARAVRVARILALAEQVFGNHDKAQNWLRSKDDRLSHRTPLSMLQTEAGGHIVENMLRQIDEGIYA